MSWTRSGVRLQGIAGLAGAALFGAWFAGTAPASPPAPAVPQVPAAASAASEDPVGQELRGEVERLGERLDRLPGIATGGRNPFVYAPTPPIPGAGDALPAAPAGEPLPAPASRPLPELIGIGGDRVDDAMRYTAVLVIGGRVALGAPGETLANRYLVVQVSADAVVLRDLESGETTTLALP